MYFCTIFTDDPQVLPAFSSSTQCQTKKRADEQLQSVPGNETEATAEHLQSVPGKQTEATTEQLRSVPGNQTEAIDKRCLSEKHFQPLTGQQCAYLCDASSKVFPSTSGHQDTDLNFDLMDPASKELILRVLTSVEDERFSILDEASHGGKINAGHLRSDMSSSCNILNSGNLENQLDHIGSNPIHQPSTANQSVSVQSSEQRNTDQQMQSTSHQDQSDMYKQFETINMSDIENTDQQPVIGEQTLSADQQIQPVTDQQCEATADLQESTC